MARIITILALWLWSAAATADEPRTYVVDVRVEVGGETVGNGSLELQPGPHTFGIAGSPHYRLVASLDSVEAGRATIRFELALPDGGEWKMVARPSVRTAIGEEGRIEIAAESTHVRRPIRLIYSVAAD